VKELERPLASPKPLTVNRYALLKKAVLVIAVLGLVGFLVSRLNLARDLHRLDARMLSGAPEGNYSATVDGLSRRAREGGGKLVNLPSNGSAENVDRLVKAANGTCDVQFALAQDGANLAAASPKLQLVARLWKAESVFFLGRDADKITQLSALAKMRIGIGPEGSGSAVVAKQMFELPELAALGVVMSNHPLAEQLDLAAKGDLDLAIFVMDEDAPFLVSAIRDRGLQIAGFNHLDVVSRRLPHFRTGRIGAGQYDPVRVIPAEDKRVLRVETLVLTNGCASRSTIIDVMTVLARRFPELVRHNKDTPNGTGLPLASAAKGFLEHEGPELADEYAPWAVDVMPPANWAYVVMAVSILFNAMSAGHRFRLWRIDDARVRLENELSKQFGMGATLGDITRIEPDTKHQSKEARAEIDSLIERFERLADRSRRQSLSMLVPMGQEMAYRYQEGVIYETLAVLRDFRARAGKASSMAPRPAQ
jgi:TRAP-type uncharacterized transport system substrate-binding protein